MVGNEIMKIGFGGGCHWCTEAIFQALKGVYKVEQGWVASNGVNREFSEAVIVHFMPEKISLERLIEIHLYTHKSTSEHSMRNKYRSAIYIYSLKQESAVIGMLQQLQLNFEKKLITKILPFCAFKPSHQEIVNYYLKNPKKPFCKKYIYPKLKLLKTQFSENIRIDFEE